MNSRASRSERNKRSSVCYGVCVQREERDVSQELPDDELVLPDDMPSFEESQEKKADATEQIDSHWQAELVARCLAGDERAFAQIIDTYGNLLLRTAYLLVRDEEVAKDIVQDSFILAWKNMKKLREPAFLRAWLLKIVVNQSMSWKRQWARKATLLREQFTQSYIDDTIQSADYARGRMEDRLDVEQALALLPLDQRAVLVLFYYHRMTMPEISTLLGVAENTLRKRLQAALDKMRRALQIELKGRQGSSMTGDNVQSHISLHKGGA